MEAQKNLSCWRRTRVSKSNGKAKLRLRMETGVYSRLAVVISIIIVVITIIVNQTSHITEANTNKNTNANTNMCVYVRTLDGGVLAV